MSTPHTSPAATSIPESTMNAITQALSGLRYGQVTIIVQDGRVMQIDRTDRRRLQPSEYESSVRLDSSAESVR